MDNEDINSRLSRAEMIKLARESCTNKLEGHSSNRLAVQKDKINSNETLPETALKLRFFIIRLLCAVFIFTAFILINNFKISYNEFNSEKIIEYLRINDAMDNMENYISSLINKANSKIE